MSAAPVYTLTRSVNVGQFVPEYSKRGINCCLQRGTFGNWELQTASLTAEQYFTVKLSNLLVWLLQQHPQENSRCKFNTTEPIITIRNDRVIALVIIQEVLAGSVSRQNSKLAWNIAWITESCKAQRSLKLQLQTSAYLIVFQPLVKNAAKITDEAGGIVSREK